MSRLFEALRRSEAERTREKPPLPDESRLPSKLLEAVESETFGLEEVRSLHAAARPQSRLVALVDERSLGAEKFRLLSTRLKYLQEQHGIKKLLVTSGLVDEGKSLVAANLSLTLAQRAKQKTLLVEGDLHRPMLARLFGFGVLQGLTEWWQQDKPITKFLYRLNGLPLWFLPAGTPLEQPLELLQSARLSEVIDQFGGWFDWIVIDSTPLLPLADANAWSRLADGILFVVREGKTPKKLLKNALDTLDNPKIVGVVLNDATAKDQHYYRQYYPNAGRDKTIRNKSSKTETS